MKKSRILLFFLWMVFSLPAFVQAQTVKVIGKVTSSDGKTLPGVSVTVKGTTAGTSTNESGSYSIDVPQGGSVLVFRMIGLATQEVPVPASGEANVVLQEEENSLDEVVVVGYGTQKKSLVTGAISSIKADQLKTVSAGRIDQALQGRTAGVTVMPNSGAPGSGMSIRIRGIGSSRSSEPLYIVDGVRAGGIEYLDPSEIASMEILKDAASAAIYGTEGANGVVMITTKTGGQGGSNVNYNFQYGWQSPRGLPKLMNAPEYQTYLSEAGLGGPTDAEVSAVGLGTDWVKEATQSAPQQQHSLNFTGGNEKSSYMLGGTMFSQDGIIGGDKSKFERYTVRMNGDHQVKPWLKVGERLSYANFTSNGFAENDEFGSVVSSILSIDPLTPVHYTGALPDFAQSALDDGSPLVRDADGYYYGVSKFIQGEYGNPLGQIATTNRNVNQNKVVGNVFGDAEIIPGLKLTTRFGIDAAFVRQHQWTPTYWFSNENRNLTANGSDYQRNYFNWQWENFLTYTRSFGDHNLTAMAGTSTIKRLYNNIEGSYAGLFREEDKWSYPDFVQDTPDKQAKITGQKNETTMLSYYGRVNYDYKNRYLFAATVRRDGSSLFSKEHRYGTFPSVSAGWVISNEGFFTEELAKTMNYLKIRASWGQNGSISNVGIGSWQAFIGQDQRYLDASGNFVLGASPTNLENQGLGWETSEQIDLGAEANFFQNQLTFSADWYKKTTKDLITNGAAPFIAGNVLNDINSGNVVNKGWEFELTYRNPRSQAFSYEIAANFSTISNEVTKTNPLYPIIQGAGVGTGWNATRFEKGYPIWYFFGYKTDGIFQNQGQIDQYLANNGISGYAPKPGDPVIVDANGDKRITDQDQTYIGDPVPDFTYGLRLSLGYKGFDLMAFLQGSQGNDVLMGFVRNDRRTANRPEFFYTDRWTGDGSTNTWFAPTAPATTYNSDMMVFDGSFARLRQLQLGYTLPSDLMQRIKFSNARVFVSLDDFFTFTGYKGLDPEGGNNGGNSVGIDRGSYPLARKVLLGLSFNF